jgi:plasmid stabilization system protein ParE
MLTFNRKVQYDLNATIQYYQQISEQLADKFFEEFNLSIERILKNPTRYPFLDNPIRVTNLKRFPYVITYKVLGENIRILVLKHKRRHPSYGRGRE